MQMKYGINSPAQSPGPLRKLATLIVTLALVVLVLMFSAVVLAIILVAGALAWAYLWWKTRHLRKQMRDFASRAMEREQKAGDGEVFAGEVIEGEVIHVVDSRNGR